jgi:hypothetical protein
LSITCRAYVTSPEDNRAEGLCGAAARCSAVQPEAPSEAPMHMRAVIRSCAVLLFIFWAYPERMDIRLSSLVEG